MDALVETWRIVLVVYNTLHIVDDISIAEKGGGGGEVMMPVVFFIGQSSSHRRHVPLFSMSACRYRVSLYRDG